MTIPSTAGSTKSGEIGCEGILSEPAGIPFVAETEPFLAAGPRWLGGRDRIPLGGGAGGDFRFGSTLAQPLRTRPRSRQCTMRSSHTWPSHSGDHSRIRTGVRWASSPLAPPYCKGGGLRCGLCFPFPTPGDGQQEGRLAPIGCRLLRLLRGVCFEPDASRARLRFKAAIRSGTCRENGSWSQIHWPGGGGSALLT
jgi:hypothetical protein